MAENTDSQIQFFNNFIPKLHTGTYEISVTQSLLDSSSKVVGGPFTNSQKFIVRGPGYQIPAADVHGMFPPNNHNGRFEESLPHVVFNKKSLPWEQIFDENNENVPWIALIACQIGSGARATAEVSGGQITAIHLAADNDGGTGYYELPPTVSIVDSSGTGASAVAVVDSSTGAITGFQVTDAGSGYSNSAIVKIGYPHKMDGSVAGANQTGGFTTNATSVSAPGKDLNGNPILGPVIQNPPSTPCQAINLSTSIFPDLLPRYDASVSPVVDEITPLAHVRKVNLNNKAVMNLTDGWCANVIAKRFPIASGRSVNYAVHVVSLIGLEDYLKPSANFGNSDLFQVISLYSWSFTCQPETGETFQQLMLDLTKTEQGTDYLLRLPVLPVTRGAAPDAAVQKAVNMVSRGYVPMTYNTFQGEQTMAFYRSPLTPVLPERFTRGCVTYLEMLEKGSGYTSRPDVTVTGGGIDFATASPPALSDMKTGATLKITSAGNGYISPPQISFVCDSLKEATATTSMGNNGSVNEITVTNGGAGYTSAPEIHFEGGGIREAQASVYLKIYSIQLSNGGSGYSDSSPPTVLIQGGGGSGAVAEAKIENGSIQSITLTAGGRGYTGVPEISFEPDQGGTATAIMTLDTNVLLTTGGSGYTQTPTVTLTGNQSSAVATATIRNGQVVGVSIASPGQGYTSAPAIQFSGGGFSMARATAILSSESPGTIDSIRILDPGFGYIYPPDVILVGGGVREARASATISAGQLTEILITDGGEGYTAAPSAIAITGGIRPMVARANLESVVQSLELVNGGSGYTTIPTVTITAPAGYSLTGYTAPTDTSTIAGLQATSSSNVAFRFDTGTSFTITGTGNMDGDYVCARDATWSNNTLTLYLDTSRFPIPDNPGVTGGTLNGTDAKSAIAIAEIVNGSVSKLILTAPGSGYTSIPTVTIAPPDDASHQATATATIATRVGSLTILDPGQGYTTQPTVAIAGPDSGTRATARAFINDPVQSASGAVIYNHEWGVFDLSYATNFLNARLLALNSRSFAVEVLQWRRAAHTMVNMLYERLTTADRAALKQLSPGQIRNHLQGKGTMTEQVMSALTGDFARQLLPAFSKPVQEGGTVNTNIPPIPSDGTVSTAIRDLQQLLQNEDIKLQIQNLSGYDPDTGEFSNSQFKNICEWLADLALLDGIPFEYLVPDERLLPPASIRFFYMDPNAMDAIIDGALSIGTHSSRDTLYSTLMSDVIRDAVRTLLHQVRANLLARQPTPPPYEDQPITGLLLRSPVVQGWPGLEVKAYATINPDVDGQPEGQGPIPLLRMDHISKDILLCLFDGVPEWVELDEPSEGLAFGVEDGQLIRLRKLTGDETGAQIIEPDKEFAVLQASPYVDPATGFLKLPQWIASLQDALASEQQLTPDRVVRIETDGGEGYQSAPTSIELNGVSNSNITAQLNGLAGVVVEKGGTGYALPPTISITDSGSGLGANAFASVSNGKVTAIQLLDPGENYSNPTVTITSSNPGSGVAATASLDSNREIVVTVTDGGSNYIYPPQVTLTPAKGDKGTGATAVAILNGDTVDRVVVTSQGTNYAKAPAITFNTGTGAVAGAIVARGQITGFTFDPSELGTFSSPPTVTVTGDCSKSANCTAYTGTLGPADFAIEMVKLPERMIFRIPQ